MKYFYLKYYIGDIENLCSMWQDVYFEKIVFLFFINIALSSASESINPRNCTI